MVAKRWLQQQNVRLGCGLLALILLVGLTAAAIWAVGRELEAVHYPGAVPIARYTNYTFQQGTVRLDNAYRTSDPVRQIYDWYKRHFNLIPGGESGEGCLQLRKIANPFAFQRRTNVWICETPVGQMILISREASLR
jgi:hypothetical protein